MGRIKISIHQKTPITSSSSIQLPSPAASPASFIVSGTDPLPFPSSTISQFQLTIFPISKTGYPNHCCLWVRHSLPYRLLITVIPMALLIRSNASHHPLPIIIQGEWVGVLFVGHENGWRRRGRTNRHQEVSSDRRRNHYRNARQQQRMVGCRSRPKTRELHSAIQNNQSIGRHETRWRQE